MSRGTVVAKRYAKALFALAREQGQIAEVESQLKLLTEAVKGDADVRAFLSAPGITAETKIGALKSALGDRLSPIVLNALSLLFERGRQGELDAVLTAYLQVAEGSLGRADAQVTSAKPLTEAEQSKLAGQFGSLLGKTVRIDNKVDPDILGGLTVRIGDTLYDGSVRGKLNRLAKELQTSAQ